MITIFNWLPNLIDYFTFYGGGGKGGGRNTAQTTTNNLDPVIQAGVKANIDLANQIGARPYQPYEAPRLAGFTPEQYASFANTVRNVGSAEPYLQGAGNTFNQLMNYNPERVVAGQITAEGLQQYMNPFTNQVIDQSLRDNDRARQLQQQQINAQAASRGAFGGSRQAVAEAENNRNFLDQQARTSSALRAQGFDTATNLMQGDLGRQLQASVYNQSSGLQAAQQRAQAANQFGNIGTTLSQQRLIDSNALNNIGEMQRQLQQQGLDLAYQDFMAEKQYPEQILALKSSAVNSSPAGSTQTATGLGGQRSNFLGGAIGGGLSGYALGSQIGAIGGPLGAVGGAVLGGLLG